MAGSAATIGALKIVLSADSAQFSAGIKDAEGMAKKLGVVLGNVAGIATAFGAAAVAAGAVAATKLRGAANSADEMGKAAQKVGLMTEELSALKYTADLAGVGFESLQSSLVRLIRSMSEVAKGGDSDAARAFDAIGVSVKNADGTLRSSAEVMGDIAEKFSQYKDGAEKTALAVAIFGRAGADMIPLLNQGRDAINESNEEAKKFGLTISGDVAKAAENFNDNMSRMSAMAEGVFIRSLATAAPIMERISAAMVQAGRDSEGFRAASEGVAKIMLNLTEFGASVVRTMREISAVFSGIGAAAAAVWRRDWEGITAAYTAAGNELARIKKEHEGFINVLRLPSISHQSVLDAFGIKPPDKRDAPGLGKRNTGGDGASEYDAEKERIEGRLQAIREGFLTEEELKYEAYQKDLMLVEEALNKKILLEEDAAAVRLGIEKKFQEEKAAIQAAADQQAINNVASALGNMGKVAESWGKKNNTVAKSLAIASSIIHTISAALKAMDAAATMGPAAAFASYAAVFTKGMAAVAALTAVNPSGQSGGGRSVGGGSASAPAQAAPEQAPRSMYVNMYGSTFGREQMREFFEQADSFFKDGGGRIVMAR